MSYESAMTEYRIDELRVEKIAGAVQIKPARLAASSNPTRTIFAAHRLANYRLHTWMRANGWTSCGYHRNQLEHDHMTDIRTAYATERAVQLPDGVTLPDGFQADSSVVRFAIPADNEGTSTQVSHT